MNISKAGINVVALFAVVFLSVFVFGCVKGKAVFATSEIASAVSKVYNPKPYEEYCEHVKTGLEKTEVLPQSVEIQNCGKLGPFHDNLETAADFVAKYGSELALTLKVKEDADVSKEVAAALEKIGDVDFGNFGSVSGSISGNLDSISQGLKAASEIIFSLFRSKKVVEAINKSKDVWPDVYSSVHESIEHQLNSDLLYKPIKSEGESAANNVISAVQTALQVDTANVTRAEGNCASGKAPEMRPKSELTCADACSPKMVEFCATFESKRKESVANLVQFDIALKGFTESHKELAEKSKDLRKIIKDTAKDDELKELIINTAKGIYASFTEQLNHIEE